MKDYKEDSYYLKNFLESNVVPYACFYYGGKIYYGCLNKTHNGLFGVMRKVPSGSGSNSAIA